MHFYSETMNLKRPGKYIIAIKKNPCYMGARIFFSLCLISIKIDYFRRRKHTNVLPFLSEYRFPKPVKIKKKDPLIAACVGWFSGGFLYFPQLGIIESKQNLKHDTVLYT